MKKSTKANKLKHVVVKCLDWVEEFSIDSEIFDDVHLEAATRAIEKRKDLENFMVAIIMECWEKRHAKDAKRHIVYNTYFVLVNAGLHAKAEMLRINFLKKTNIDIQKESLMGDNENGDNNDAVG